MLCRTGSLECFQRNRPTGARLPSLMESTAASAAFHEQGPTKIGADNPYREVRGNLRVRVVVRRPNTRENARRQIGLIYAWLQLDSL